MQYFLVFALFIIAVNGEVYVANSADPNNPGHCYHKELKLAIKRNETVRPVNVDQCAEFTCLDDGLILVGNCLRYQTPCKYGPVDFSKPFPDCCSKPLCD